MIFQVVQHKHHIRRQGREPILKSGGGVQIANDAWELLTQLVSAASNMAASVGFPVDSCCATGKWPESACAVAFGSSMTSRRLVLRLRREGVGDSCLPAFGGVTGLSRPL